MVKKIEVNEIKETFHTIGKAIGEGLRKAEARVQDIEGLMQEVLDKQLQPIGTSRGFSYSNGKFYYHDKEINDVTSNLSTVAFYSRSFKLVVYDDSKKIWYQYHV